LTFQGGAAQYKSAAQQIDFLIATVPGIEPGLKPFGNPCFASYDELQGVTTNSFSLGQPLGLEPKPAPAIQGRATNHTPVGICPGLYRSLFSQYVYYFLLIIPFASTLLPKPMGR